MRCRTGLDVLPPAGEQGSRMAHEVNVGTASAFSRGTDRTMRQRTRRALRRDEAAAGNGNSRCEKQTMHGVN